jgi:cytochrome c-type biogenesis protein
METTTFFMALLAGFLSFLSPCILPVAPGYLAMISGSSLSDLRDRQISRRRVLLATALFVLGFSLVFILMGVTSSLAGQVLRSQRLWLSRAGGVIVILLGLHQARWLPIPWLYHEKKLKLQTRVGRIGAFVTGLSFALGWTPCVGPILGSILALAGNQADMARGITLLIAYSAGLSLPFCLLALAFERVSRGLSRVKPFMKYLEWASGLLLVTMGLVLFTGNFSLLINWIVRITGGWNLENWLRR